MEISIEILTRVLGRMYGQVVAHADYQVKLMQGGSVGEVYLITGTAETIEGINYHSKLS